MNNIFESKNYPTVMYILITVTLLMIVFNLADIANKATKTNVKVIGFVVDNNNNNNNSSGNNSTNSTSKGESYSLDTYGKFYFMILIVAVAIAIVSMQLLLPKIKKYT